MEYPETDAIRFLKKDKSDYRIITYGNFMNNSFAPFDIADVGGYSSLYPRRYGEFLHLSQYGLGVPIPDEFSRWTRFKTFGSPLLDLINTKYILLPPFAASVRNPELELVYEGEIKIYKNKDAFPRVFFVPRYQFCGTRKQAYEAVGACSSSDFRNRVILESMPPTEFRDNNKAMRQKATSKIQIISYKGDRIELDVYTDQKGFLVISDNYHPGWRARVDGQETTVLRGNYIMRAIPIRDGKHKVELTFRPKVLIAGMVITAAGWVVLFALIGISHLRKRKERKRPRG
jgi:hypothetical protein